MSNLTTSTLKFNNDGDLVIVNPDGCEVRVGCASDMINYSSSYFDNTDKSPNEPYDANCDEDLEILKLVKGYLASYLQKILDDSDDVIEEVINRECEKKIKELTEENLQLKDRVVRLEVKIDQLSSMLTELLLMKNCEEPSYTPPYTPYPGTFPPIWGGDTITSMSE